MEPQIMSLRAQRGSLPMHADFQPRTDSRIEGRKVRTPRRIPQSQIRNPKRPAAPHPEKVPDTGPLPRNSDAGVDKPVRMTQNHSMLISLAVQSIDHKMVFAF